MWRMPTTSRQGISGWALRSSALILLAASPTISTSFTSASASTSSSRSPRDRPCAMATARRAASRMCRRRVSSSACIDGLSRIQDALPDVAAERRRRLDVDRPTEQIAQVLLNPAEREVADPRARLELDQHVDVARVAEVLAEHRPEEREPSNAVLAA